jgi:integrase
VPPIAKTELTFLHKIYLSECEFSKNLSKETIKSYNEVFTTFLKVLPEVIFVTDVSPQIFALFFKRLSTRKRIVGKDKIKIGVKTSTISTYYNKLIAFVRWLENNDYLEKYSVSNRIVKPVKPSYEDDKALDEREISKISSSITINALENRLLFVRDLAILNLFIYTGVRKGELLALRVQDVDFEKRLIFIRGVTSKSKRSRYIPIHSNLESSLKSYLKERKIRCFSSEYLIVSTKEDKVLTSHGLKFWVSKYVRLSGVKFHAHQFRHTFACSMAKNNADITSIMRVLGHSSFQMTERYLRSIRSEDSRSYIDKISF